MFRETAINALALQATLGRFAIITFRPVKNCERRSR